jgi:hypothetical protein
MGHLDRETKGCKMDFGRKNMKSGTIAEVFGFHVLDSSEKASSYRKNRLCPFNNKVPNCTKDKAANPLGVCAIFEEGKPVITCPVRFRESWLILRMAASLLFPPETRWTSLSEVPLYDADDKKAGNLDFVVVSYDDYGKLTDFFALEVQAVYISGNIRQAFEKYIENGEIVHSDARPDYLSSSRKRLIPQLLYKGGILKEWGKKMIVIVQDPFFKTLPDLPQVETVSEADLVWLIFDLVEQQKGNHPLFSLRHTQTIFTAFWDAMNRITRPRPGPREKFERYLQERLSQQLESAPEVRTLFDLDLVE